MVHAKHVSSTIHLINTKWKMKCNWNIWTCESLTTHQFINRQWNIQWKCVIIRMLLLRCTAVLSCLILVDYSVAFNSCVKSARVKGDRFIEIADFVVFAFVLLLLQLLFFWLSVCLSVECLRLRVYKYIHVYVACLYKFRHYSLEWLHISVGVLLPSLFVLRFCSCCTEWKEKNSKMKPFKISVFSNWFKDAYVLYELKAVKLHSIIMIWKTKAEFHCAIGWLIECMRLHMRTRSFTFICSLFYFCYFRRVVNNVQMLQFSTPSFLCIRIGCWGVIKQYEIMKQCDEER